jgi:hypothetical protein
LLGVSGKADVLVSTLGFLKCWCLVSDHLGPNVFRILLVREGSGPIPPSFEGKKQSNITSWSFRYSFVSLILLVSCPPLPVPSINLTRPSRILHPTVQALHPPPHGQHGQRSGGNSQGYWAHVPWEVPEPTPWGLPPAVTAAMEGRGTGVWGMTMQGGGQPFNYGWPKYGPVCLVDG